MCVHAEDVRCFVLVCSTRNRRPNPEVPHFRPLLWVFSQADFAAVVAPVLLPCFPACTETPAAFESSAWMGPPAGRWACFVNGKDKGLNSAQVCKLHLPGAVPQHNKTQAGLTPAAQPLCRNHPTAAGPAGQTHPSPSACALHCWLTPCSKTTEDGEMGSIHSQPARDLEHLLHPSNA